MEWEEGQGLSVDPGIRFKLDLPTTRERLRLIIESDPEETQGTLAEQGSQRLRGDSQTAGDTVVGRRRLTDRGWKQHWATRSSAGARRAWHLVPRTAGRGHPRPVTQSQLQGDARSPELSQAASLAPTPWSPGAIRHPPVVVGHCAPNPRINHYCLQALYR